MLKPFTAAMIVPTGIGASVGGFGGDATQAMNLLASVSDVLITHPNVANAAAFQQLPENALYVEGYGLDQFFKQHWALCPSRKNRIAVVFDQAIDPRMLTLHLNTVNAVKTVYGVDIIGHILTEAPLALSCTFDDSGCSSGRLENPKILLTACHQALDQGADAIAVCAVMPELTGETAYKNGQAVDPVGGIEAILSHLVVSTYQIPCAHAPVFAWEDAQPEYEKVLEPKVAAEFITPTFLPCVLTGLAQAPRFATVEEKQPHSITVSDLDVLVTPIDALGGVPVLSAFEQNIPVIAVSENTSVLDVTLEALGLNSFDTIQIASSYYEAAGMVQAMRQGLNLNLPSASDVGLKNLLDINPIETVR